jgi:hypothetical protein
MRIDVSLQQRAAMRPAFPACDVLQPRRAPLAEDSGITKESAMPAPTSSRTLWKGAISFGLVHIPVTLHSATAENRMKFNLLNKSSMTRVGNQQVDKATGEAMPREEIVKGFEVEKDQFVVLTPRRDQGRAAEVHADDRDRSLRGARPDPRGVLPEAVLREPRRQGRAEALRAAARDAGAHRQGRASRGW